MSMATPYLTPKNDLNLGGVGPRNGLKIKDIMDYGCGTGSAVADALFDPPPNDLSLGGMGLRNGQKTKDIMDGGCDMGSALRYP